MVKRIDKRQELIRVGSEIVIRQGFNAASLNDILSAAGVPKGSFYYYFSSKEDFGLAIVDDFAVKYEQKLESMFADKKFSPLMRLRNYFKSGIADMERSDCNDGCLMGNLAQELSAQNELFRDRLKLVFTRWEQSFIDCLSAAKSAGELKGNFDLAELAKFILSGWQGSILQAKVTKSTSPMQNFVKMLFQQILI